MRQTKHILLMAAMLLCCVTRISAEIILTEEDGLLATTSTNSAGTLQYEFTSDLFTLDEATNTLYFTFLRGKSNNVANPMDHSGYPFVALAEFFLYDGEGNEIALSASNFSTNAQEPTEGPITNICDDDRTSFWHSTWSSGVGDYHYLKITLPAGQELTKFKFGYITRYTSQCLPSVIHVGTTNDNISFSLSGTHGENINWSFIDGNLIVEGTGTLDGNSIGLGGIKSVEIKEGITAIGEKAFYKCGSLTSITIPESVTSIGNYAFYGCSSLTAITIPEGVTSIGNYTFYNCSNLTSITIPEGVTSIGDDAFAWCNSLTAVHISNIEAWCKIEFGGSYSNPLYYAHNLYLNGELVTNLVIPEGVTSIGNSAFYNCSSLAAINIPASVTSIGNYTFYNCSNLTSITIPEGVTSIGDDAFAWCNSLTAVHISNIEAWCKIEFGGSYSNPLYYAHNLYLNGELVTNLVIPEGVTSIGNSAFYNCSSLAAINIPASVTSIGNFAFYGCSSLTTITLPEGSKLTSIGECAFFSCSSLTTITLPEGVTSIGDQAFLGCSSLTAINIPEGVTSIGHHAFSACISLTAINIPEGVTSIGSSAFSFCSSLTAINIPEGVTSIGERAFYNCSSLTAITLPEGVTSIGEYTFESCSRLTAITIPESVTSIGNYAFRGCSSLTAITCHAVTPPTVGNSYTFYGVDKSIPVYVPEGSVEDYKAAEYWEDFTNITALTPTEVSITINQYGSGTYCSPYALDFSNVEGLKAYAAAGYDTKTGVVTLLRVMTAKAGVGLFIKGEPGEYRVPVIENTSYNSLNMLVGTLTETAVNATSGDGLYANYKYTIKEGDSQPLFYRFTDGSTLGAGKAYLQIPMAWLPQTSETKSISLRFDEGEGTTDMEEFTIDNSQLTIIYDLYGRRVAQPVKGSLYIVNGRKVVY